MQKNIQPFEYDYIHTQFKGILPEEQERVKLEINPDLEKNKEKIIKPIIIKQVVINFKSSKKSDVQNTIKKKLFEYINDKPVSINAVNIFTHVNAVINASTVEESTKELLNKIDKYLIAALLINSKNIFEKSIYIFSNNEAKNIFLKGKQKIHRYANVIRYENEHYIVIITLKENKNKKDKNKQKAEFKIYHLAGYKISGIEMRNQNTSNSDTAIITIAQLRDFVKGKILEKYNNDYKILQKFEEKVNNGK